jgi:hypothetical protein
MLTAVFPAVAEEVVARLDLWLDTMRGPAGYGGPVVHWWRDSLVFCGPGLDWRYEGIIAGYLTLFERTRDPRWLGKARRAGDDLVGGQLPTGNYRHSSFELNPGTGGTPHEAAADIGLLLLARVLRDHDQSDWQSYLRVAMKNLRDYYLGILWNETAQRFQDDPQRASFVPNKAATLIEALCQLADLTGDDEYLARYVRPTADAILAHQLRRSGNRLDGAIAQNTLDEAIVEKYFPFYNARCVPGLLAAYERLHDARYLDAACAALSFVLRWRAEDGGFPQAIYGNGRVNRCPMWIAGVGDVLRAAELARPYGSDFPLEASVSWLLSGRLPSGGIASAVGFGAEVPSSPPPISWEFRDLLPVCGWADKAFRYLAGRITEVPDEGFAETRLSCSFRGHPVELRESAAMLGMYLDNEAVYLWQKGSNWAQILRPWAVTA